MSGVIFAFNSKECFLEYKNKMRKPGNNNNESHQIFIGSHQEFGMNGF